MLIPFAIAGCGRGAPATSDGSVPPVADDGAPASTLPAPMAAPGSAVTGMPTQPPPPSAAPAVAEVPAEAPADATASLPADGVADPAALPAPVDESATVDPTATAATATAVAPPTAAPAAPAISSADVSAASLVINQYMAALSANAPARAQSLWATTPNDSAVLQLARGAIFNIAMGTPAADSGGRVTIPVDVRGKGDDGADRHVQAAYSLQRSPTGTWRIYSAAVRDVPP